MMKKILLLLALVPAFVSAQFAPETERAGMDAQTKAALEEVLAGDHRSERNRARDGWRNPLETLSFFGLRQDMTVVELWPGGGWYTEVIAPVLREQGQYYAAHWPKDSPRTYVPRALARYDEKLAATPARYDGVKVVHIGPGTWDPLPEGSADLVLSFRSVHNFMEDGYAQEMFDASFRMLKPGGHFGIVQHRGDPTIAQDPKAESGYVAESWIIALARNAGFEVVANAEINANPKDLKHYPEGVWTLPPSSRLADTPDGPSYAAIGESDRLTLLLVRPAAAD